MISARFCILIIFYTKLRGMTCCIVVQCISTYQQALASNLTLDFRREEEYYYRQLSYSSNKIVILSDAGWTGWRVVSLHPNPLVPADNGGRSKK